MATKLPSIPPVPASVTDPAVRQWMQSLAESVAIRAGQRGDPLDRSVTLRELPVLTNNTSVNLDQVDVDRLVGDIANFIIANIENGSITNELIGDYIQSHGYIPGVEGWKIDKGGYVQFYNLVASGKLLDVYLRNAVIENATIIQGNSDNTIATEADAGAGQVRSLALVNTNDKITSFSSADDKYTLAYYMTAAANYTGEGVIDYSDGVQAYKNFDRYLKYAITPVITTMVRNDCSLTAFDSRSSYVNTTVRVKIAAVKDDNTLADLLDTGTMVFGPINSDTLIQNKSFGYVKLFKNTHKRARFIFGSGGSQKYVYTYKSDVQVVMDKLSLLYNQPDYKGFVVEVWSSHTLSSGTPPRGDTHIESVLIRDNQNNYT